jgi:hypothetical protein
MNWLDYLERRFGRFAIHGLAKIVVVINAITFMMSLANPYVVGYMTLDLHRVMRGEVWRLVSFMFVPGTQNIILELFVLGFIWWIGTGLERAWGSFRFTLFCVLGMIGSIIAACFVGGSFSSFALSSSLFFAFAHFYPEEVIYIMMILPIKVKWAAWVSAAFLLFSFIFGEPAYQVAMVAAYLNYLLFFGPEIVHSARMRRQVAVRRERFAQTSVQKHETLYKCVVCGRTERSNPELEFRVGKDGNDYCSDHLPKRA